MSNGLLCVSPNGGDFARGDGPADRLIVATIDGVLLLERKDGSWRLVSHTLRGVHIGALLNDAASGMVFAGAHSGGLFASFDGGRSWQPRMEGLAHEHVYTIASHRHGSRTLLYAGTEPAHLYVSSDLGASWDELSGLRNVPGTERWTFPAPPHLGHVKQVCFHPHDDQTIFVCVEQGALLRSNDMGRTWAEIDSFYVPSRHRYYKDVHRLRISPTHPSTMYLTGGDGFFRTDDSGRTWSQLMDSSMRIGYPDDIHLSPSDPGKVLIAGAAIDPASWPEAGAANACVMSSLDGGRSWKLLSNGLPEPMHGNIAAMTMHAHGDGFELFIGTTDGQLFASHDGGEHWQLIGDDFAPVAKANHYIRLPKSSAKPHMSIWAARA